MNHITIQNLDHKILRRLKEIAWHDGQTFEDFLRRLFTDAATPQAPAEFYGLAMASAQSEHDPGNGHVASYALPLKKQKHWCGNSLGPSQAKER
jgi:hypothetical protein